MIGYKQSVYTACNYVMLESCGYALSLRHSNGQGYSISDALAYADAQVLAKYGFAGYTNDRLIRGNVYQRFRLADNVSPRGSNGEAESTDIQSAGMETREAFINDDGYMYGFFDFSKLKMIDQTGNDDKEKNRGAMERMNEIAKNVLRNAVETPMRYELVYNHFSEETGVYSFVFNHKVNNMETGDFISIMLNAHGEVVSFAKPAEGAFDGIQLTEGMILNAERALETQMDKNKINEYAVTDRRLVLTEAGYCIRFSLEIVYPGSGEMSIEMVDIQLT